MSFEWLPILQVTKAIYIAYCLFNVDSFIVQQAIEYANKSDRPEGTAAFICTFEIL